MRKRDRERLRVQLMDDDVVHIHIRFDRSYAVKYEKLI